MFNFILGFKVVVTPTLIKAKIGQNVKFNCSVEPLELIEKVSITWSTSNSENTITQMRTLSLDNVRKNDEGTYVCKGEYAGKISQDQGILEIVKCDIDEFTCTSTGSCIDYSKRCDTIQDCPNNEDEVNCSKFLEFITFFLTLIFCLSHQLWIVPTMNSNVKI